MMLVLLLLAIVSVVCRRLMGSRARLKEPATRASRFLWSHLVGALVAALAVPLGLAHGWLIAPDLELIVPFWVAALALGFLALPRERELGGFALPMDGEPGSSP
jgi:hypothetical protein